jgi:hydrogenase nickel incorporation protein HypA/HybF
MHEYSVVQALLGQVEDQVRGRGAVKVHRVRLKLGESAGVDPELLQTAIDTFKKGSVLEDAAIEIVHVPTAWACGLCKTPIQRGEKLQCALCGGPGKQVSGDELILDQLELEVP